MYIMYMYTCPGAGSGRRGRYITQRYVLLQYVKYGRFPKFHRVFWGRDPGTLKSDIVSKKHPQLICSDLRLSN